VGGRREVLETPPPKSKTKIEIRTRRIKGRKKKGGGIFQVVLSPKEGLGRVLAGRKTGGLFK